MKDSSYYDVPLIFRNLLHLLDLIEKAEDKQSWVDVSSATSTLRDILEDIPHKQPLPWE
jgi:hypothetical protein|tara:strand:- start:427 stop:603 length:177 start_codon:yes stop_codon:yes gene_type:complete